MDDPPNEARWPPRGTGGRGRDPLFDARGFDGRGGTRRRTEKGFFSPRGSCRCQEEGVCTCTQRVCTWQQEGVCTCTQRVCTCTPMHRSDPVPLESSPRFAHVALFVGSIGHLLQELGGTRTHGPPCSEAHRQEGVTQRMTDALVLAPLRVIVELQPARRRSEVSVWIHFAVVVYMDVELEGVCAGSTVDAFEDRQVGVEVTGA